MWWQTILVSLRELRRNLMRSTLTILGIVIGVAAVIAMLTVGKGIQASVTSEIESQGSNLLNLYPWQQSGDGGAFIAGQPFKEADAVAIEGKIDGLAAVAPVNEDSSQIIFGNVNRQVRVIGSTNGYMITQNKTLAIGKAFTDGEIKAGDAVCILGSSVREKLFGRQDPIGAIVRLKNISFKVKGVFQPKQSSTVMIGMGDENNFILIPLRALQRRIQGYPYISTIMISAKNGISTDKVKKNIEKLMHERRRIRPGKENDFRVDDMKMWSNLAASQTGKFTTFISAIAAISLLVGGIGIMNIMLVSVTERTREIGIRLAIGALERDVLKQFLLEAMVLTSFGGLIGIIFGLSAGKAITHFAHFPFILRPEVVVIAFVFSALVGLIFGFFPARKAAMLDPIEALRHE
jgi:putative ABC transport system permease protein